MTHQEFLDKWNGKYLERVDNSNRNQCFDLVVAYAEDVHGLPRSVFAGLLYAYQIFDNPTETSSKNYDFIKNTPYAVPKQGDIIVWSKSYNNIAGHTAVVHNADASTFTAFSQNDPTGSPCILKKYSYNHISGWLRSVKQAQTGAELEACLKAHKEAVESADKKDRQIEELKDEIKHIDNLLSLRVREKNELIDEVALLNGQIIDLKESVSAYKGQRTRVENDLKKLQESYVALEEAMSDKKKSISKLSDLLIERDQVIMDMGKKIKELEKSKVKEVEKRPTTKIGNWIYELAFAFEQ